LLNWESCEQDHSSIKQSVVPSHPPLTVGLVS
jgi:hypothetical protein